MIRNCPVLCVLFLALLVPACGDDDPAAPGGGAERVLGTGTWGSNFCTSSVFDQLAMSAILTGAPAVVLVDRDVASGDHEDPTRRSIIVMDAGSPSFAAVVERLTNGTADMVQARYDFSGGSGSFEQTENGFFGLALAEDFAGREITRLRFVVEEADISPQEGGGTCARVLARLEVLGR